MALSVASTGLSLGGVVLTPLSILMVESLGFETAAPWIGSMFLVGVIPVAWIYLRESPESMGLHIDGITPEIEDEIVVAGTSSTEEDGVSFKEARSRRFF